MKCQKQKTILKLSAKISLMMAVCVFCFVFPGVSQAEVAVKLKNGSVMTFESVALSGSRLECHLKEGIIYLTADQLSAPEKERYFGTQAVSGSGQVKKPADPKSVVGLQSPRPPKILPSAPLDPAPYGPSLPVATTSSITQKGGFYYSFSQLPDIHRKNPDITYNFQIQNERYYIYIPPKYDDKKPFGLVVFIGAGDVVELPAGWNTALNERNLLFIAPQGIGESKPESRRLGLTIIGIVKMMEKYKVDANRVYVVGVGGGGKLAVRLSFDHPEYVRGCISYSGAEFFKAVKPEQGQYGVFVHPSNMVNTAKRNVYFALVTQDGDAHRNDILNIYNDGFAKHGFRSKLFDIPASSEGVLDANVFNAALEFVESGAKEKMLASD